MTLKTTGAEVVEASGKTLLVRIHWRDGGQRGESLRIVRPVSRIERFLFAKDRLSPGMLKRVSVLAYLLIPVLIFLNTVVPRIPTVPYLAVLALTFILVIVAFTGGFWFFFGAGMVDRLQENPLRAMKAPAVPCPDWWVSRMDEITPEAIRAFQAAYLAREVDAERTRRGEVIRGRFTPAQKSYRSLEIGLGYLAEHKRHLTELLAKESLEEGHISEMLRVAEEPAIPAKVASASDADDVRSWARSA